ncbi:Thioredoxin H9 [Camellia lanceoleosa]|uniref:Thioredoxin H9 n=1 Tax=Camellia lanceoleosa TaxID=1840588 RepID=A0ACC0FQ58_9ERIC|nr:Thioredoxin H9 [Camellia lanceoleosa]
MVLDLQQVVANFSASWCGPCRVIAPFYSELSHKYPVLMFLFVDVDELTQVEKLVRANKSDLQKKATAIVNSVATSQK